MAESAEKREEEQEGAYLSLPSEEDERFEKALTRSSCSYESGCGRYRVQERRYATQYAHVYFHRLEKMRGYVTAAAIRKWRGVEVKDSLMKVVEGERCCIIGTLFKKMELKPSILKEVSATHHLLPQPPRVKYVSSRDELVVEDSNQRISLCGALSSHQLVTGVVAGLLGIERQNGVFQVEELTFAGLPSQREHVSMDTNQEKYVLLVSGLNLGSSWCDQLSVSLLVDYITGQLGGPADQRMSSKIVRVIIAGNSITNKPANASKTKDDKTKFLSRNYAAATVEAVKELDHVMAELTSCVDVDLMPGPHDPANHQLPQQPLHRCLFPEAGRVGHLHLTSNPYQATIDGLLFMGCSGQNVDNIYKFSTLTDRLQILENTLEWRHMVPTAPDTLSCYPFTDRDPHIIEDCPHVYFCGNQPSFQSSRVQGPDGQSVLVISVPTFDLTHSCVLVRIGGGGEGGGGRGWDCEELTFSSSLSLPYNPHLEEVRLSQREGEEYLRGGWEERGGGEGEVSLLQLMDQDDDDD